MPQGPIFIACIDESGNEGFQFGAGSSAWLVLAAVLPGHDALRRVTQVYRVTGDQQYPN